jgi:hypothetical protein
MTGQVTSQDPNFPLPQPNIDTARKGNSVMKPSEWLSVMYSNAIESWKMERADFMRHYTSGMSSRLLEAMQKHQEEESTRLAKLDQDWENVLRHLSTPKSADEAIFEARASTDHQHALFFEKVRKLLLNLPAGKTPGHDEVLTGDSVDFESDCVFAEKLPSSHELSSPEIPMAGHGRFVPPAMSLTGSDAPPPPARPLADRVSLLDIANPIMVHDTPPRPEMPVAGHGRFVPPAMSLTGSDAPPPPARPLADRVSILDRANPIMVHDTPPRPEIPVAGHGRFAPPAMSLTGSDAPPPPARPIADRVSILDRANPIMIHDSPPPPEIPVADIRSLSTPEIPLVRPDALPPPQMPVADHGSLTTPEIPIYVRRNNATKQTPKATGKKVCVCSAVLVAKHGLIGYSPAPTEVGV